MKPGLMRWIVFAAWLLVLIIITTSAYIRLSQAGFGCADWPSCYGRSLTPAAGQLIPEQSPLFWARALHRVAASAAGMLMALVVFVGWDSLQGAGARLAAAVSFALAAFLAWLGLMTPSSLPAVSLGNLLGGMAMVASLWWLHMRGRGRSSNSDRALLWIASAALVVQFVLGGLIGARHAALACTTLPACAGTWWPESVDWRLFDPFFSSSDLDVSFARLDALVMAHRYGAILVAAALCLLSVKALRRGARAAARGRLLLGMLGLQLLLGAGMVLAGFPLLLVLMHNLGAALLLASTVSLCWQDSTAGEGT